MLRAMRLFSHFGVGQRLAAKALVAVATLCLAVCLPATAAPADPGDAVTRLLIERGVLSADLVEPAAEPGFAQQVRDRASDLVLTAMNFLGVPYRLGGSNEATGFDCSGFTRYIFERSLGLALPRRADEQASAAGLLTIKRDELKPGDLVFFNTLRRTFSHVGIYVGEGKFIHSPRTGGEVRVEDMRFAYWAARFPGARRVEGAGAAGLISDPAPNRGTAPR